MTVKIIQAAATQEITFADTISESHLNPTYCGARTYNISPNYNFLTISGTTLNLFTIDVLNCGTYKIALKISLTDYPMISSITKNF
jgi:hypothetical protein